MVEASPRTPRGREAQRPSRSIGHVMLTGVGFLADSYDVWVINIVADIMKLEPYQEHQSDAMVSYVKSALLVGAMLGQVTGTMPQSAE